MTPTPDAEATLSKVEKTEATVLLALTRLEAKLDVALTQHAGRLESHAEEIADHEARVRALENRPYVRPAVIWSLLAIVLAIVSAEIAFVGLR